MVCTVVALDAHHRFRSTLGRWLQRGGVLVPGEACDGDSAPVLWATVHPWVLRFPDDTMVPAVICSRNRKVDRPDPAAADAVGFGGGIELLPASVMSVGFVR